ncbi:hypothetical protein AUP68_05526 [Ilyonectria robusta]
MVSSRSWIDKNGDQPSTGFQVRWPAFSTSEADPNAPPEQRDPKSKCDNVSFGVRSEEDPSYINYWTRRKRRHLTGAPGQLKRQHSRRNEAMESQLIVGDVDDLSARFLCESATSVGPDLANTSEGLFCDMGEKKLYDLCSESVQAGARTRMPLSELFLPWPIAFLSLLFPDQLNAIGEFGNSRAAAVLLAHQGAKVALVDFNIDWTKDTKRMIDEEGGTSEVFQADVTDDESSKNAVAMMVELDGAVHILVNIGNCRCPVGI